MQTETMYNKTKREDLFILTKKTIVKQKVKFYEKIIFLMRLSVHDGREYDERSVYFGERYGSIG